jgi:hypothetical protein
MPERGRPARFPAIIMRQDHLGRSGMSDGARDPVASAAARLEAAVERLAAAIARPRPAPFAEDIDAVPRAEVAAMAERLDATIARLRAALSEELRVPDATDLRVSDATDLRAPDAALGEPE